MRRVREHDAAHACTARSTETLDLDNCQTYIGDATLTKPPCAAPGAMAVAKRSVSRQLMPDAGESKRWGTRSDWRRTGERKRSPVSMWALRVEEAGQSETTPATTSGCTNVRAIGANADRAVWCTITVVIERQLVDFVCSVGDCGVAFLRARQYQVAPKRHSTRCFTGGSASGERVPRRRHPACLDGTPPGFAEIDAR